MKSKNMQATSPSGSFPDLHEITFGIVDTAISITSADCGNLQLMDPVGGDLKIVASRGLPKDWLDYWNSDCKGKGVCGTAFESGGRIIVEDVEHSPIFIGTRAREIHLQAGVRAVQSTPLVSRSGKVLGMFSTHYKKVNRPGEQELHLLDVLARLGADAIEQGQMQDLLRESEGRFRALVNASSEVVYRMNPDWTEMRELRGRSFIVDTAAPDPNWLSKYIHPDDQPQVLERIGEAIRNKSVFELERRVLKVDGSIGWTFSRAIPIEDDPGEIVEWFGMASDVTVRKNAEEEVRASEARLTAFFETRAIGAAEVNEDGQFTRVNETLARITGYSKEELRRMRQYELSPPERVEEHKSAFRRFFEGKSDLTAVTRQFRRKDGCDIWVRINGSLLSDRSEKPLLSFAIFEDVTQQREAEDALAQRELKFRSIAETMPGIVWSANSSGSRDYHNRRWQEYTGMTQEEGAGFGWTKAIHPDDLPKVLERWARSVSALVPYEKEYRMKRGSDGSYRWHLARAQPLHEGSRKVQMWIGNVTDIHEQKLAVLNLEGERILRERFVNTLTHDLRTPLTSAKLRVQLIIRTISPEMREHGQKLGAALDRIDNMIQDLLDANQIKAGHGPKLNLRSFDPVRLVEDTLEELRTEFGERFICHAPDRIEVVWDRNAIQRVLENLCTNGIKYGTADKPVTVSLFQVGNRVRIAVHNEGIPIPVEQQSRIFEEFGRATTAYKGQQKGWGLGLVLVKGLVEAHGGVINLTSAPGQGTCFTVELPADARSSAKAAA